MKVTVIMKYAPDEVKMALRQAAPSIGESFRALEQVMLNFIISGREYDGQGNFQQTRYAQSYRGQQPMDVGGIDWKGKDGKGTGRYRDGKGTRRCRGIGKS